MEKRAIKIFSFLNDKKAKDIHLLYLRDVNAYFDYFLIATANSTMHLNYLSKEMKKNFSEEAKINIDNSLRMNDASSGWVIIDFIEIVVHLFLEEQRAHYRLERLWHDAKLLCTSKKEKLVKKYD